MAQKHTPLYLGSPAKLTSVAACNLARSISYGLSEDDVINALFRVITTDEDFRIEEITLPDEEQARRVAEQLVTMLSVEVSDIWAVDELGSSQQARELDEESEALVARLSAVIRYLLGNDDDQEAERRKQSGAVIPEAVTAGAVVIPHRSQQSHQVGTTGSSSSAA